MRRLPFKTYMVILNSINNLVLWVALYTRTSGSRHSAGPWGNLIYFPVAYLTLIRCIGSKVYSQTGGGHCRICPLPGSTTEYTTYLLDDFFDRFEELFPFVLLSGSHVGHDEVSVVDSKQTVLVKGNDWFQVLPSITYIYSWNRRTAGCNWSVQYVGAPKPEA